MGRDMVSSFTEDDADEVDDRNIPTTSGTSSASTISPQEEQQQSPVAEETTTHEATPRAPKRKMSKTDKIIEFEHKKLVALTDILNKEQPVDEWQKYANSIAEDLRFITHPLLKAQIKTKIASVISEFVVEQYSMNSSS